MRVEREEQEAEVEAHAAKRFSDEEAGAAPPQLAQSRVERLSVCVFEVYEGKVYDLLTAEKLSATEARANSKGARWAMPFCSNSSLLQTLH